MAEFESNTYAAQTQAGNRADKIIADSVTSGGKLCPEKFEWTVDAGTGASDTVLLGYLPAGVTVIPGSTIHCSASGGANNLNIGFAGAASALASAVPTAAGIALINPATPAYKNESRQAVVATLSGAITAAIDITITLHCQRGE
jgi:hypothetical protein